MVAGGPSRLLEPPTAIAEIVEMGHGSAREGLALLSSRGIARLDIRSSGATPPQTASSTVVGRGRQLSSWWVPRWCCLSRFRFRRDSGGFQWVDIIDATEPFGVCMVF